ncbi:MAG TPA: penicillin acylase family protein, partial [Vicinamibacterales bacterium]|nr:penicillin acylase family protein [Vicinamibacterales bacterium]
MFLRSVVLLTLLSASACTRPSPPAPRRPTPLPQVDGTLSVSGLRQPVEVVRDRWGISHVNARNEHDLFFAQGFVQAQDRLFQMDLWRRSVQGRLAQVLGPNFIDRDVMTARVQYHGDLAREWAGYAPGTRQIAEAFIGGINAWVVRAR